MVKNSVKFSFLLLLLANVSVFTEAPPNREKLFSYILHQIKAEGMCSFWFVEQKTKIYLASDDKEHVRKKLISYINELVKADKSALVDEFFKANETEVDISPLPQKYPDLRIVSDDKISEYFSKEGGGWDELYRNNPAACGIVNVSIPVFEPSTGIILVYEARKRDLLFGRGSIKVYKVEKEKLQLIGEYNFWVA
jgi:hypothetical protein